MRNRLLIAANLVFAFVSCMVGTAFACDQYPIADITDSSKYVCVAETVQFDGSGSYDPDGGSITDYDWDFEYGASDIYGDGTADANCVFSSAGTYTVRLKVKDDEGWWSTYDSCIVYVVKVGSLEPDKGAEIFDSDPNSTFIVRVGEGTATVTATPYPDVDESDLPDCWSLTGGTGSGKLTRTVDCNSLGSTLLTAQCNTSEKRTWIIVSPDGDSDSMPDYWETYYGLDPCDPCDADSNDDSDDLTNLQEYQNGTDPTDKDTDSDGMDDGWELDESFNPLDATDASLDLDSDDYSNVCEYLHNTEPDDPCSVPTTNITIDVPNDVDFIQSAIDASIDGDVIEVKQGSYYETIDLKGKNITLQSTDPNDWDVVAATIIDANDMGTTVTFAGTEDPNCLLKGLTITGGNYGSALDNSLVGFWKLDGDPNDSSGNGRDGTINGNPVWDPNGYIDGALDFDGNGDYVEIMDFKGVTHQHARTCAAWIKTDTYGQIVSWGEDATGKRWTFWVNLSGVIRADVSGGGIVGTTSVDDGVWHHVAVVWENDGTPYISDAKLYVDGQEENTTCGNDEQMNTGSSVNVKIGDAFIADRDFDGLIDNVRIYDRALSSAEIRRLYGSGGGIAGNVTQATVNRCIIKQNTAGHDGGGVKDVTGSITNCSINDNSAGSYGGGLSNCSGTIANCVLSGNTASDFGGGLDYCGTIVNCTVVSNTASTGGGLVDCSSVTNCIIWDNGDDLLDCSATYSNIEDGDSGEGNTNYAPDFVDPGNDDYHLDPNSACIDIGNPSSDYSNEPSPNGYRINMGAYGNTPEATTTIDSDSDGIVNPEESRLGSDSFDADTDGDSMPDGWELSNGLNLLDNSDGVGDLDNDGLNNADEHSAGTNPNDPDSDNDNMPDGWENTCQLNPLDPNDADTDFDEDNYTNIVEYIHGSEPNDAGSLSEPITIIVPTDVGSIQQAINWSIDGDVIEVLQGTYLENVDFTSRSITVRSTDPTDWGIVGATIIDANGIGDTVTFDSGEDANSLLTGFTITGGSNGVYCSGTSPIISNCKIEDNSNGTYCCNSASPLVTNNMVYDNTTGIYCSSSPAYIKRNLIYENDDGIELHGDNCSPIIKHNTIVDNMNYGIEEGSGTLTPAIGSCIFWRNGDNLDPNFIATYSRVDSDDLGDPNSTHNLCDDPEFVDPNGYDYHLKTNSPCINMGDPNGSYASQTDINGDPRLRGANVDMGADEAPVTWYVATDANGLDTGFSWEDAFSVIQDGIDAAFNDDTVIIAQGIYYESVNFNGKAIVMRSTNPTDWEIVEATVIDANNPDFPVVSFDSGEGPGSVLDGLTTIGGSTGIYCTNASPTITHCKIDGNNWYGLHCYIGSPTISHCRITENEYGLGFSLSSAHVNNCIVAGNSADGIIGGAPSVINCTIVYNNGYGIYSSYGLIDNCIIWGNTYAEVYNSSSSYSCIEDGYPGSGIVSYFPYFADVENDNYHLLSYSPGIDIGNPDSDYSSEPNSGGGRINIGAYGNTFEATLASADVDNDSLPDTWELLHWPNDDPNIHDPNDDPDSDDLNNLEEYRIGLDPNDPDCDDDGLSDGEEVSTYQTNPLLSDTDSDGMPDGWEVDSGLVPLDDGDADCDADNDGLTNAQEYTAGTNANDSDSDNDEIPDAWELFHSLNPADAQDADTDLDNDGYSNLAEYVHGSDPNDDSSCAEPLMITVPADVNSIQQAIDWSINGDVIEISEGVYNESINFNGKAITVRSADPTDWDTIASTIVDANGLDTAVVELDSGEDSNSILTGLTLIYGTKGVDCNSTGPTISRCIIKGNNYGIYCSNSASPLIVSNKIYSNTTGIYIWSSLGDIENNLIFGNDCGIKLGGGSCSPVIQNNSIVDNPDDGIGKEGFDIPTPTITSCIFWRNGDSLDPNFIAVYSRVDTDDLIDPNVTHNICADPLFVDHNNNNYHLQFGSPCINTGDPNGSYDSEIDIDGNPRLRGANIDMGADEGPVTWYVDTDANGLNTGFSWEDALLVIQDAINAAFDGDTIIVAQGTYYESIDFKSKAILLKSTNATAWEIVEATVIDANNPDFPAVTFASGEDAGSVLDGLTITGGSTGVYCTNASPTITHCKIDGNNWYGLYCYVGSPTISHCRITENEYGLGFSLSTANVNNCIVAGNSADGMVGGSPFISNCSVVYNGRYGICYAGETIKNCIVWGNNTTDLYQSISSYSCLVGDSFGGGSINYFPYFVDPNSGNYHLMNYSPCIDAGDPNSDYSNEPYGGGGCINMGAYGNTAEATLASVDGDSDGLPDSWELLCWPGCDPNIYDPNDDTDNDNLDNLYEYRFGLDPNESDSDGDGIPDGDEVSIYDTDPLSNDSDHDGMPDGWEVDNDLKPLDDTDAADDADNDGLTNIQEYSAGTNANDSDSDNDGMPDGWEGDYGLDPVDPNDADSDSDEDGYSNLAEYLHDGDPADPNESLSNTIITVPTSVSAIQQAINASIDGDVVKVLRGIYNEAINFSGKAITIQSVDPTNWDVVFDTIIDANGLNAAVVTFDSGEDANSILTGLSLIFGSRGVDCDSASPVISKCIIEDNDYGVYCSGQSAATIQYNKIGFNTETGISSSSTTPPTINNNWIYKNDDGILFSSATSSAVVRNNTIVYNGYEGICVLSGMAPTISNCIFWGNIGDDLDGCTATYSCIQDGGTGTNISADPNFIDVASYNYRLNRISPCKNAGDPNASYTGETDIDSQTRQAQNVDMGADEVCEVHNITKNVWYENIQDGIDATDANNIVEVYEWTFYENIDFDGKGIVLRSTDPEDWQVIEKTVIWAADPNVAVVTLDSGEDSNSILTGFTVTSGVYGVYCGSDSSPEISRCTIWYNLYGIYCDSGSPLIARNKIFENWDTGGSGAGVGIISNSSVPPTIRANWIYNNDNGIKFTGATSSAAVYNNTIVDNYRIDPNTTPAVGIYIDPNCVQPTITNCIFYYNDNDIEGGEGTAKYCRFTDANDVGDPNSTQNITTDPEFISLENYNLHLKSTSVCLSGSDPSVAEAGYQSISGSPIAYYMGAAPTPILYVTNSGGWEHIDEGDVHPDLQSAIADAVPGSEIWVKKGIYKPTTYPEDRGATFQLKNEVRFYGGFKGTENSIDERDWTLNETILSGDIDNDGVLNSGNSYSVVTASGTDDTVVLDGFTVKEGYANGNSTPYWSGAGMYCYSSSCTISNCTFSNNRAKLGAGMCMKAASTPLITNCMFTDNWATPYHGGGIRIFESGPTIKDCAISRNKATRVGIFEATGGGIWYYGYGSPSKLIMTNCIITDNEADAGGGLHALFYKPGSTITNCFFSGNKATNSNGGGISGISNSTVANCVFTGNEAEYHGGGVSGTGTGNLINCTFYGNSTGYTGGGLFCNYNITVTNCIFWDNSDKDGEDESAQIHSQMGTPDVSHTCIEGPLSMFAGNNNIDDDPCFVDSSDPDGPDNVFSTIDDGLALKTNSPCVDAGDDTAVPDDVTDLDEDGITDETIPYDIAGKVRVKDGNHDDTTTVDMGAYELPRIWYVDGEVENADNGKSWQDAFDDLQEALTVATYGDEIWVAATGNPYVPGSNRTDSFTLVDEVALYGGFEGESAATPEKARNTRDWVNNETVLSGDIGETVVYTDNCYHVVIGADGAIIDGFTITAGNASSTQMGGGGMANTDCSPMIANCMFTQNVGSFGGGMENNGTSSPIVTGCTFSGNRASLAGGGMMNSSNSSSATLINCTFNDNIATTYEGGGICHMGDTMTLTNCKFGGNSAKDGYGGGISSLGPITLTNCQFVRNSATYGGGVGHSGLPLVARNCTFNGNEASGDGGGIYLCEGTENEIYNSILWGNTSTGGDGDEVYVSSADLYMGYCDCTAGGVFLGEGSSFTVEGNINADPDFVGNPSYLGGLRLSTGSLCIDAGSNDFVGVPTDILGKDRIMDGDGDGDTAEVVDMGAYEYELISSQVTVPNVLGMLQSVAESEIVSADLVIGTVTKEHHNTADKDEVFDQDPGGGTYVSAYSNVALWVSLGRPIVPDVVNNMTETDAEAALNAVTLVKGDVTYEHSDTPQGLVISQDPVKGTEVDVGSSVDLEISLGKPEVPDIIGMTQSAAQTEIENENLTVGNVTEEYNSDQPQGRVFWQQPPAGTAVPIASPVDFILSKGLATISNVVGMAESSAIAQINDDTDSTVFISVTYEYSETVDPGHVISQDPTGGTVVDVGSTVYLVVASSDILFTLTDVGSGRVKISYTTPGGISPRSIALKVELSNTTIASPTVMSHDRRFNCLMDYAASIGDSYTLGVGHPLADWDDPGVPDFGHGISVFSISMASYNMDKSPGPPSSTNLITLQLHGIDSTTVTISADDKRKSLAGMATNLPVETEITLP